MIVLPILVLGVQAGLTIYVSPAGSDSNIGTYSAPLATIGAALNAVVRRTSASVPATVILEAGNYWVKGFDLGANMSNLTILGEPGSRVLGSSPVTKWQPVVGDPFASTFSNAAQAKIQVADLTQQMSSQALAALESTNTIMGMDVLEDRQPLVPSQYPAPGSWLQTSSKSGGTQLGWNSSEPLTWTHVDQILANGYFYTDSGSGSSMLSNFNAQTATATMATPLGVLPGSRFKFVNVPEELKGPGQYFLNRSTGRLYFWPASSSFIEIDVTSVHSPLFTISNAHNVRLIGLDLEGGLWDGIKAYESDSVVVESSRINGFALNDVEFEMCSNSSISRCAVSNSGGSAVVLNGGNPTTFASSGNFIADSTISNYSRFDRGAPGITLEGDGNTVTHNLIQYGPGIAVGAGGANEAITYNDIQNVCTEDSDLGAIYEGRNPLGRGLLVEGNRFRGVSLRFVPNSRTTAQISAVYLDDMLPGATVRGNIFECAGSGVIVGGGRDNTVVYNVFVGNPSGIHIDARGMFGSHSSANFGGSWHYMDSLQAALTANPCYAEQAFPLITDALTNNPFYPVRFNISDNVYVGSLFVIWQSNLTPGDGTYKNNVLLPTGTVQSALAAMPPGYTMPALSDIGVRP